MKKFMIILCLLLISCQQSYTPQPRAIHFGTTGIQFFRMIDAPPSDIIEGTSAPLVFRLENRGAYTVDSGRYALLGVDPNYFELTGEDSSKADLDYTGWFNIEGKSVYNPVGGTEIIGRQIQTKLLKGRQQSIKQSLWPVLCYPYETVATANVCIDTDPYNILQGARLKTCNWQEPVAMAGGQGGPVAATLIKMSMESGKVYDPIVKKEFDLENAVRPSFTITIQNAGRGRVVEQSRYADACEGRVDKGLFGFMEVRGTLSNYPMVCTKATWSKGTSEAKIHCTADPIPTTRGNYLAPLQLELRYGYVEQQAEINFNIIRLRT